MVTSSIGSIIELIRTIKAFLKTLQCIQWDDHEAINDFGPLWSYWNSINEDSTALSNDYNITKV